MFATRLMQFHQICSRPKLKRTISKMELDHVRSALADNSQYAIHFTTIESNNDKHVSVTWKQAMWGVVVSLRGLYATMAYGQTKTDKDRRTSLPSNAEQSSNSGGMQDMSARAQTSPVGIPPNRYHCTGYWMNFC